MQDDAGTKKIKMGNASAVIFIKGKLAKNYMVTEDTMICINGTKTTLTKNTTVQLTKNGVPKGIDVKSGGMVIADSDAVASLVDQGILVLI